MGFLLFQQIIVGISTYAIVITMESLVGGDFENALIYISIFVISLIVVYFPSALSQIFLEKWIFEAFSKFVVGFTEDHKGNTQLLRLSERRDKEVWFTTEAFDICNEMCSSSYEVFSAVLNASVSLVVIAFLISTDILIWYGAAAIFILILNQISKRSIEDRSKEFQESRSKLNSTLLGGWANIHSGNDENEKAWMENYQNSVHSASARKTQLHLFKSIFSTIAAIGALGFVGVGNWLVISENLHNLTVMATLVVTLPRQLQIMQAIFHLHNVSLNLLSARFRNKELLSITKSTEVDLTNHINQELISIRNAGTNPEIVSSNDLESNINALANGRYTITGENGSGKSTYLSYLKSRFANSVYIPTESSELIFNDLQVRDMSSGQTKFSQINHLITSSKGNLVYFLDEWDANLDSTNRKKIDKAIETLAVDNTVIEVLHT